jgi:hypothetical protein
MITEALVQEARTMIEGEMPGDSLFLRPPNDYSFPQPPLRQSK